MAKKRRKGGKKRAKKSNQMPLGVLIQRYQLLGSIIRKRQK